MASGKGLRRLRRAGLHLDSGPYVALKDPCPVQVGRRWHLFGTAVHHGYRYEILHATAPTPTGPWRLHPPSALATVTGACVAAPGVIAEGERLHMFLQTEYNALGGRVEHLVSDDGGACFAHHDTSLTSRPGTPEAGIYDPHPAEIAGRRYLVYSGFSVVSRPDIFLAHSGSGSWAGPWERLGRILHHAQVPDHNQHHDPRYEWGLEGGQLVGLPDGRVLLNAVCFLAEADAGNRQRVFFALAPAVEGPYEVLGPALHPAGGQGEIGHATAVIHDGALTLFFQERTPEGQWGYGLASAPLDGVVHTGERIAP